MDATLEKTTREHAETLLRLNTSTFEAGQQAIAYHSLAAALHCAEEVRDERLVDRVLERALGQQALLDGEKPDHRLSTKGSHLRGTTPLFTNLAGAARAIRVRLKTERLRREASSKPVGGDSLSSGTKWKVVRVLNQKGPDPEG